MGIMIRRAILAGTVAGMTALGISGPVFTGAAFAEPSPPPSDSTPTPPPDTGLDVTVTPNRVEPGATVNIKAIAAEGIVPANASAQCAVFDASTLKTRGSVAAGMGHVRSDAKAGVYEILVQAMTPDALKLRGTARITVVLSGTRPSPPSSVTPTVPTVPKGGVGTGGGGTADDATSLGMISAGSAIALLGVTATVSAIRRRRSHVRD